MDSDSVAKLTDAQREVLRRWHVRRSAKEIAIELGVTHWAVNERLRAARRTLGAASSQEAAQMLAAAEGAATYKPFVYDTASIVAGSEAGIVERSDDAGEWPSRPSRDYAVHEEQVPFRVSAPLWHGPRWPIPRYEGDRNDLTIGERLLWIGALALGAVVAVGTLITISWGIVRLIGQLVRLFS